MNSESKYERLVHMLRQQANLGAALALLEWDQETYLPSGAIDSRVRQIGALSSALHRERTAPEFLNLVDDLATRPEEFNADQAVDIRETKWKLDRQRALDEPFVRQRAELHAHARNVWISARRDNDFAALAPYLARIVELAREMAQRIDASRFAYDVLLEAYEPGATTATLRPMLEQLRDGLVPLVERLRIRATRPSATATVLCGDFPIEAQRQFNREVLKILGFDLTRGRLDEAAHPFSTSIGDDSRLTTRYAANDLRYGLFSTIHEAGHGMYEQGLEAQAWGTPCGESCSLGIHESQSRLWENLVGRSAAFWEYLLPLARRFFPALENVSVAAVAHTVNEAKPSFIRTESDEVTYNLHIILRFELELELISGTLRVVDLPEAWRAKMQRSLGIEPPTDRDGVLQDVHWSCGDFGYFPTYTLGNIYAAQLMQKARTVLGDIETQLSRGDCAPLLEWMRVNVHRIGQRFRGTELIERATGRAPDTDALLAHLENKVGFIER